MCNVAHPWFIRLTGFHTVAENHDDNVTTRERSTPALNDFNKGMYDGDWLQIVEFVRTMISDTVWKREEANRIRKKAYRFFLREKS